MAGIRRAPKTKPTIKTKIVIPLHRRILGRGAAEIDAIDDLRAELEKAYDLDQMEYDTYLDCCEALDIREAKAKTAIAKAAGRYVKPEKVIDIPVTVVRRSKPWRPWQIKIMIVVFVLFLIKLASFKP